MTGTPFDNLTFIIAVHLTFVIAVHLTFVIALHLAFVMAVHLSFPIHSPRTTRLCAGRSLWARGRNIARKAGRPRCALESSSGPRPTSRAWRRRRHAAAAYCAQT